MLETESGSDVLLDEKAEGSWVVSNGQVFLTDMSTPVVILELNYSAVQADLLNGILVVDFVLSMRICFTRLFHMHMKSCVP